MATKEQFKNCISVFGKGNFKFTSKNMVTYKSVFNNEESIVIRTKDVISIMDPQRANSVRYVLVTGPHKGIYIWPWQFINVQYRDKTKLFRVTSLVRLNKEYSKVYTFKDKEFDAKPKKETLYWDDLLELAKAQAKEGIKIRVK